MAANSVFTPQFRLSIVERVLKGQSVGELSHELNIGRSVLYRKRRRWAVSTAHFPSGKLFVGMA
jgi:transposase-like protein